MSIFVPASLRCILLAAEKRKEVDVGRDCEVKFKDKPRGLLVKGLIEASVS